MTNESVWIVDDDSSIRWVLQKALQTADISCLSFENPEDLKDYEKSANHASEAIYSNNKNYFAYNIRSLCFKNLTGAFTEYPVVAPVIRILESI